MTNLKECYQKEIIKLSEPIKVQPWENVEFYKEWIAQTYFYAAETTRLLALASACMPPSDTELHYHFCKHVLEEKGHEKLCTNDLKLLNDSITNHTMLPATSALFQSQYFWITRMDPKSFFGYVLLLEGIAAEFGDEIYNRVNIAHEGRGCSFIKVHALEDKSHIVNALNQVSSFSQVTLDSVMENMQLCGHLYNTFLNSIAAKTVSQKQQPLRIAA